MASNTSRCLKYLEWIALNTLSVTGVVFLNLPPIVNALIFTPINSTNVYIFIFFQEQGRRNDLFTKGVSPVPQDDSNFVNSTKTIQSLLSTPGVSTNIKSESDHCDPLSWVASGSRCHSADYLKEMKGVESSVPCLMYSHSKPPPPLGPCVVRVLCKLLTPHTVCSCCFCWCSLCHCISLPSLPCEKKNAVNRISTFEKWLSPPIRWKCPMQKSILRL